MPDFYPNIALILAGGGARGAYQAGVLQAVAEILNNPTESPFRHLIGTSAGAINAAHIAGNADQFSQAVERMLALWDNIRSKEVFYTDWRSLSKLGLLWTKDLLLGGVERKSHIRYLLDTAPLRKLLQKRINFHGVAKNLEAGRFDSLSVSCLNYPEISTVHFIQSPHPVHHWKRHRRYSCQATLALDHIMASCAIPIFFPPVAINGVYYGDGSVRNFAPLNPAIHLGADRLFIVGVRNYRDEATFNVNMKPSIGRQLSVLLNSMFLDSVDSDLERLHLYNQLVNRVTHDGDVPLRRINIFYMYPSQDISAIAYEQEASLPSNLHYLLQGLGSLQEASALISYLFFEPDYCARLVMLGYKDAMNRADEIVNFFWSTDFHSEPSPLEKQGELIKSLY